jgi:hypothetical protein
LFLPLAGLFAIGKISGQIYFVCRLRGVLACSLGGLSFLLWRQGRRKQRFKDVRYGVERLSDCTLSASPECRRL